MKKNVLLLLATILIGHISMAQINYKLTWQREATIASANLILLATGVPQYQEVQPYEWYQVFDLPAPELITIDRDALTNWNPQMAENSDFILGGLLALPMASLASEEVREQAGAYLFMYGEVLVSTGLMTAAIKGWTERARPYVYNNEVPLEERIDDDSMRSFVSGHTALAFGAASFMSTTYMDLHPDDPLRWVVLAGTFSAAGVVGYMRVESGQHFPTDVLAGAALGTAIGWAIPALHREKRYRSIRWNAGWNQFRLVWDF